MTSARALLRGPFGSHTIGYMTRALVIADRNPQIDIPAVIAQEQAGLVITLGDLTREDILSLELVISIPKIGVYGNHDTGRYMPGLGIWDMHLKTWEYNGLRFGGFQGCVRYKPDPAAIMYTQEEAHGLMRGFPEVDVFISHCPPRGINDEDAVAHQGFDAFRAYLDRAQPAVWLHGHTYPTVDTMVTRHGATRIEYVHEYRLIDL